MVSVTNLERSRSQANCLSVFVCCAHYYNGSVMYTMTSVDDTGFRPVSAMTVHLEYYCVDAANT